MHQKALLSEAYTSETTGRQINTSFTIIHHGAVSHFLDTSEHRVKKKNNRKKNSIPECVQIFILQITKYVDRLSCSCEYRLHESAKGYNKKQKKNAEGQNFCSVVPTNRGDKFIRRQ